MLTHLGGSMQDGGSLGKCRQIAALDSSFEQLSDVKNSL